MIDDWKCVDRRHCARGYSLAMFTSRAQQTCSVVLYLDGVPYWTYQNLSALDASNAMDDLEITPGPRGDSSWRAVLARCLSGVVQPEVIDMPMVVSSEHAFTVGTWEWVKSLSSLRMKTIIN